MRTCFVFFFTMLAFLLKAQKPLLSYAPEEVSPYLLAKKITALASTEKEKVDAIFYWITRNISYNTGILYAVPRKAPVVFPKREEEDTGALAPLSDRVAENVLRRRVAVCDGYARLFQSLCHHANIKAEIVTGYVRTALNRTGAFRSNHTWNAVQIDSTWHLLDATWASGYVTFANEFKADFNPRYFLPSPKEFIADHYPEDLRWTLLPQPPQLKEFSSTPFKYLAFTRFKIESFSPASGIIQAAPGDTIKMEVKTSFGEKNLFVTSLFVSDSLLNEFTKQKTTSGMIEGEKITVDYTISAEDGEWLYVIYNNEPILRYQLKLKKDSVWGFSNVHLYLK